LELVGGFGRDCQWDGRHSIGSVVYRFTQNPPPTRLKKAGSIHPQVCDTQTDVPSFGAVLMSCHSLKAEAPSNVPALLAHGWLHMQRRQ
jgi:hypothetical protein